MDLKETWELAEHNARVAKRALMDAEDVERNAATVYLKSLIPDGTTFKARHMYGPERTWVIHYVDESKLIKWICSPLNKDGTESKSVGAVVMSVRKLIEYTNGS